MARRSRSDLPGLQAERTSLAWERTSLALLVNGTLLLLRHLRETGTPALPVGVLGLVLALVCAVLGASRAYRIRSGGSIPVARRTIVVIGIAVLAFCLAVTAVLVGEALTGPGDQRACHRGTQQDRYLHTEPT